MGTAVPWISSRIAAVVELDPGAPFLEYERRWYRWGDLADTTQAIATPSGLSEASRPAPLSRPRKVTPYS